MRKDHVTVGDDVVVFDYPAKGGQARRQRVIDEQAAEAVDLLRRRRSGGDELLAYKDGRRWRDVRSADINTPVAGGSRTARKRAGRRAIEEVAHHLGNTPAVCRASYIDPRVFDRFDGGLTIGGVLPELAADAEGWPAVPARRRGGGARPDRRRRIVRRGRARRTRPPAWRAERSMLRVVHKRQTATFHQSIPPGTSCQRHWIHASVVRPMGISHRPTDSEECPCQPQHYPAPQGGMKADRRMSW